MWNLTLINTGEWMLFGQVYEIVDWPNPSIHFVFWFKYLCNKAVGFTTHLAMRKGWPSPTSHSPQPLPIFCLVNTDTGPWFFIFQIDGIYRQRLLVADITAIDTRACQARWGRSSFHPRNSLNYLSIIIGCSYLSFILPWVDSTLLKHSHPSLFNKSSWIPEGASVEVGTTCCWGQAP